MMRPNVEGVVRVSAGLPITTWFITFVKLKLKSAPALSRHTAHRVNKMAQIALEEVLPILRSFVVTMRTDPSPSVDDRLSDMGLDSLTTINVIVTAAETLELDLEKLEEMTEAPSTIGAPIKSGGFSS